MSNPITQKKTGELLGHQLLDTNNELYTTDLMVGSSMGHKRIAGWLPKADSSRIGPGFTLIEMAIVLIIIGLIASLVLPAILQLDQQDRVKGTHEQLSSLRQRILGYALIEGQLPTDLDTFGDPKDAWGQDIDYLAIDDLQADALCNATSYKPWELTSSGPAANNTAFFLGSPGPDHSRQWSVNPGTRTLALEVDSDDIIEFVTIDYLYRRLCPAAGAAQ
jgi:prepilin-type N-terminal cleavage/methylation domain-containing protein